MNSSRPKISGLDHQRVLHLLRHRCTDALRYLETYRLLCLSLKYRSPLFDLARRHHVNDLYPTKVTAAKLAINRHIEEREVMIVLGYRYSSKPSFNSLAAGCLTSPRCTFAHQKTGRHA